MEVCRWKVDREKQNAGCLWNGRGHSTVLNAWVFFQEQQGQRRAEPAPGSSRRKSGPNWAELQVSAACRQGAPQPFLLLSWSRRLTSPGPVEDAGHKSSFVWRWRLRAHGLTKRLGPGASEGRRRGGGEGREGLDPEPGTSPPYTCQWPQATGFLKLAGDERLRWRVGRSACFLGLSSATVPQAIPALSATGYDRQEQDPAPSPKSLCSFRGSGLNPQCVQAGWSYSRGTIPTQQEASTGDGSFLLS